MSLVDQVIDRLMRDGNVTSDADGSVHTLFPVEVSRDEGMALREWVIREGAERTIEVGLGYGVSSLFICQGILSNAGAGGASPRDRPEPSQAVRERGPADTASLPGFHQHEHRHQGLWAPPSNFKG